MFKWLRRHREIIYERKPHRAGNLESYVARRTNSAILATIIFNIIMTSLFLNIDAIGPTVIACGYGAGALAVLSLFSFSWRIILDSGSETVTSEARFVGLRWKQTATFSQMSVVAGKCTYRGRNGPTTYFCVFLAAPRWRFPIARYGNERTMVSRMENVTRQLPVEIRISPGMIEQSRDSIRLLGYE